MKYPINKIRITSRFGNRTHPITGVKSFHNGIDLACPIGTPVYAPASGVVKRVFENKTGGKQLIIEHDNDYTTGYAHLSEILVSVGDVIEDGELVAETGNTGASTGAHLHLTLRFKGELINPQTVLKTWQ